MPRQILLLLSTLLGLWGTWSIRGLKTKDRIQLLAVAWFPALAGLVSIFFSQE